MVKKAVEFNQISKYYKISNVHASKDVSFSINQGEIHAICGENGAGKSTLMNILFGLERQDSGFICINEKKVDFSSPSDAIKNGIGMVHQHFMLVNSFSVSENIFLGMENNLFLKKEDENKFVKELSEKYSLEVNPKAIVDSLPVGMLQRVEILKMLARNVEILIFDEPTAVLTPREVEPFLNTMKHLSYLGKTVIFISHKLQEVLCVADRITVMRKGSVIGTKNATETTVEELADMMVGRKVLLSVNKGISHPGNTILEISNLTVKSPLGITLLRNVSLRVKKGEIYGISGVSGNGQEALVAAIAGSVRNKEGLIKICGIDVSNLNVSEKRKLGVAWVPEDRINTGLNMKTDLLNNTIIGFEKRKEFNKRFSLNIDYAQKRAKNMIDDYEIYGATVYGDVSKLSGGNMQKVVLARELSSSPSLLIVEQPTRGLDVGSIEFVHKMLIEQRDKGVAILLVSVELEEIISLSDRVGVLFSGQLQGELEGKDINSNDIGHLMMGYKEN